MNTSKAEIKSFANGYTVANAVAGAVETPVVATTGFFAGIRFAIRERRGVAAKPAVPKDDAAALEAATKIYNRAHPSDAPRSKKTKR